MYKIKCEFLNETKISEFEFKSKSDGFIFIGEMIRKYNFTQSKQDFENNCLILMGGILINGDITPKNNDNYRQVVLAFKNFKRIDIAMINEDIQMRFSELLVEQQIRKFEKSLQYEIKVIQRLENKYKKSLWDIEKLEEAQQKRKKLEEEISILKVDMRDIKSLFE
jgi:hypothetical protein